MKKDVSEQKLKIQTSEEIRRPYCNYLCRTAPPYDFPKPKNETWVGVESLKTWLTEEKEWAEECEKEEKSDCDKRWDNGFARLAQKLLAVLEEAKQA